MLNKYIFLKDPVSRKLANQGVASVNESDESILRYELETFVCSGQYEKGLVHILRTYLENLKHPQPARRLDQRFFRVRQIALG